MTAPTLTRAQALKELHDCYQALYACEERFNHETPEGRWQPDAATVEDIFSDMDVYGARVRELERFLASEVAP